MEVIRRLVRNLATEVERTLREGPNSERIDSLTVSAERLLRAFVLLLPVSSDSALIEDNVTAMQVIVNSLNQIISQNNESCEPYGYSASVTFSGSRGRPKIDITASVLDYFLSHGFSATTIAMILQVSLSTVRRRLSEHGIRVRNLYSNVSDTELDRAITSIQHQHPNCGYRMMSGFLAQLGHRVQQSRIREAMARTDPEGMISRWCNTIQRRQYSVFSPNSLWHIDGNHRLIRYL